MNKEEILNKLVKIVADTFGENVFREEMSIENTPEWDSLRHIQLIVALEKEFNIQICFEDAVKMISLRNIVNVLASKYVK